MSHDDFPYQGSYSVDLSSVAALAFLVWDIVITIDQEVDAVWSKPNGQDSYPPLLGLPAPLFRSLVLDFCLSSV
ncbi:hypothetical protein F5148DRAFT_1380020 [Russula earlei]|uniref:Uncharacterized protein n=1 Tax=Russula earlei TaxID=71964 RepID=A0ACC0TSW7_9AGAM|nr:hypothetical protein F5148DRAFT_1380020 [Russula earlei]